MPFMPQTQNKETAVRLAAALCQAQPLLAEQQGQEPLWSVKKILMLRCPTRQKAHVQPVRQTRVTPE